MGALINSQLFRSLGRPGPQMPNKGGEGLLIQGARCVKRDTFIQSGGCWA